MLKFFFIILFLTNFPLQSKEFKLICSETEPSNNKNFLSNFSKIVNFEERTLFNYSGGYFDDVILFGRNEVIISNKIFNTMSTFNRITNRWTVYKGQFIKIYKCEKERRRF